MTSTASSCLQNDSIKIAIPMADGIFSEHFGAAKAFVIFQGDRLHQNLGPMEVFGAPEHTPGALPKWLESQQVDVLISSAIGERALIMLANAGIEVFLSDGQTEPSALASACLAGSLTPANPENSRCNGSHHDHGDDHQCHH